MAGERGSAVVAAGTAVLIMLSMSMLFHCHVADAVKYKVIWDFKRTVENHPSNNFKLNDQLVFQYSNIHNALEVDLKGYNSCNGNGKGVTAITNGQTITLSQKKTRYFICTAGLATNNHCKSKNMKWSITVG